MQIGWEATQASQVPVDNGHISPPEGGQDPSYHTGRSSSYKLREKAKNPEKNEDIGHDNRLTASNTSLRQIGMSLISRED